MKVVLFGATGMVGSGVLTECRADSRIRSVLAIGRSPSGVDHQKVRELIRSDFFNYEDIRGELIGVNACFFCLGVSSVGMDEATYHRLTYELTIAAARALAEYSPGLTFCYVSGEGTDTSERGRQMWARVKGKTENELLRMPHLNAYMFRPGYIHPLKGVRSKTRVYQAFYSVMGPFYPVLQKLFPTHVTTTENVGRAMIEVSMQGYGKRILENDDINGLAAAAASTRLTPRNS